MSEANIREVCKDILEQAKSMYVLPGKPKDDSGKGNIVELPNEATINTAVSLIFLPISQYLKSVYLYSSAKHIIQQVY